MLTFKVGDKVTFNDRAREMFKKTDEVQEIESVRPVADPANERYETIIRNAGHTQFVTLKGSSRTFSGAHFDLCVGSIVLGR